MLRGKQRRSSSWSPVYMLGHRSMSSDFVLAKVNSSSTSCQTWYFCVPHLPLTPHKLHTFKLKGEDYCFSCWIWCECSRRTNVTHRKMPFLLHKPRYLLVEAEFCRCQTSLQLDVSWRCSPGDPETPPMTAQTLDTPEEVQTLPLPLPWREEEWQHKTSQWTPADSLMCMTALMQQVLFLKTSKHCVM